MSRMMPARRARGLLRERFTHGEGRKSFPIVFFGRHPGASGMTNAGFSGFVIE